ncbi:D-alanyl-D-alanine carboxypeptidase [Candidatus Parcubacteria bacterium]|nr:D-alanyl-D-alanine carboxypeptidase [Candidatus Parcubacteria bacterium]
MENNPYNTDYHKYLETLKASLDQSNGYVNSGHHTNEGEVFSVEKPATSLLKFGLGAVAVVVVGISVVSFLTQSTLLLLNKNKTADSVAIKTDQEKVNDELKSMYVRADLNRDVFATDTEAQKVFVSRKEEGFDINKYFNINIPGVSRIGFDEKMGNQYLTDNINKYSDKTLVIGTRENPDTEMVAGGDETLVDKYDLVEKAILPVLSSRAYLMADLDTGEIIIEKNSDAIYPIASISKVMTAVIATEKMNLQEVAIVSRDATNAYGGQGGLKLGEKIRLTDLVFPLLMESSNDAAEVFADHYGHQEFLDQMNLKAASLGMEDTYYNDPSGLDPKNSSTPKDLLKLVRYIWKHDPTVFDTTRVKQFSIKGHTWLNRNPQLLVTGYIGGKNGYIDQALQTTASIFEIPTVKGGMRKVVIVILKSNDKNNDVIKLINLLKRSVVYTP